MATGGPPIMEEETNHLRAVYLCYVIAPEAVRSFFDNMHTNLAHDLAMEKKNLAKVQAIKKFQWNQLYPPIGKPPPKSTDFDITLLLCLLRNMMPTVKPPPLGFDQLPHPQDITDGANIARIKYYRNMIAHSTDGKMPNTEFNNLWSDLEAAINGLTKNKYHNRISEAKVVLLDGHLEDILHTCDHLDIAVTNYKHLTTRIVIILVSCLGYICSFILTFVKKFKLLMQVMFDAKKENHIYQDGNWDELHFISEEHFDYVTERCCNFREQLFFTIFKSVLTIIFYVGSIKILLGSNQFDKTWNLINLLEFVIVVITPYIVLKCFEMDAKTNTDGHENEIKKHTKEYQDRLKSIRRFETQYGFMV